ncbi:MAG: hypothetical protein WAQ33_07185, partial [Gaiellaceae bacterium]
TVQSPSTAGPGRTGGGGGAASVTTTRRARIASRAGTITLAARGVLALRRVIDCGGAGPACKVAVVATRRTSRSSRASTKLGSTRFIVLAGTQGDLRLKLSRQALRRVARSTRLAIALRIVVQRGDLKTTRTLHLSLAMKSRRR